MSEYVCRCGGNGSVVNILWGRGERGSAGVLVFQVWSNSRSLLHHKTCRSTIQLHSTCVCIWKQLHASPYGVL